MSSRYQGIPYQLEEVGPGLWQYTFDPPIGPRQTGVARGERRWAQTVVRRAIGIWHLMNRNAEAA